MAYEQTAVLGKPTRVDAPYQPTPKLRWLQRGADRRLQQWWEASTTIDGIIYSKGEWREVSTETDCGVR
jgi:hypothetical protein